MNQNLGAGYRLSKGRRGDLAGFGRWQEGRSRVREL